MKITIKDIAREAGVSMNTVSRALNGKDDVNEQTREKIEEIAKALHYTPNQFAKGLRSQKSNVIGVIVTNIANPFYSEIVKVAEGIARKHNYDLMLCNSSEDKELERHILSMMQSKFVDGILITPVNADHETIALLEETSIPYVIINRQPEESEGVSYVVNDDENGAYLGAKHLCERGVKEIHYLAGPKNLYTVRQRIKGSQRATDEYPGTDLIIHNMAITLGDSYEQTLKILDAFNGQRIGLFAYNDNMALGAMKAVRERGKKIPSEVALVGYDDILFASMLEVPLTTIRQSSTEIGEKGSMILMKKLSIKKGKYNKQEILEPELIVRSST
jgi:LacI family transcriptional regulator